jgi:hypothetical protein
MEKIENTCNILIRKLEGKIMLNRRWGKILK